MYSINITRKYECQNYFIIMKKILILCSLFSVPLVSMPQMRWVFNGTTPLKLVLARGMQATPVYVEVNNPAPNAITVIGSNAWIISEGEFNMVKWDIGSRFGSYMVPFGYGTTEYLPLTLSMATPGGDGGSILFSTWHTPADNATVMPFDVTGMAASISGQPSNSDNSWNVADRFWVIDTYTVAPYAYSSKPALSGIDFSYISNAGTPSEVASPNVFAESNLAAQRFNPAIGMGWGDWIGAGGTDVVSGGTGIVNSGAVSAANFFRSWTLTNSNSPLPIQFSSFTDQCDNGLALIQWTSQTELNNDYYTIKKTTDNFHFETVGTVKGAGTSSFPIGYNLTDNYPYQGTSYYLLYQTDFNGNTTQAGSAIPFTGCGSENATTVNGFNTINYIEILVNSASSDKLEISLVNIIGQIVIHENKTVVTGNNEIRLNNNVSPGIYLLNVKSENINYTRKLIIYN